MFILDSNSILSCYLVILFGGCYVIFSCERHRETCPDDCLIASFEPNEWPSDPAYPCKDHCCICQCHSFHFDTRLCNVKLFYLSKTLKLEEDFLIITSAKDIWANALNSTVILKMTGKDRVYVFYFLDYVNKSPCHFAFMDERQRKVFYVRSIFKKNTPQSYLRAFLSDPYLILEPLPW